MDAAGDWVTMQWHEFGPAAAVGSGYGAWQITGAATTNVELA